MSGRHGTVYRFHKGDRVRLLAIYPGYPLAGRTGTVTSLNAGSVVVKLDGDVYPRRRRYFQQDALIALLINGVEDRNK